MDMLVLSNSSATTRILVIGGTGIIGQHLVAASLNAAHPTAVLVRPATVAADAAKASLRFMPSEYGCDVEVAEHMLEPARSILGAKVRVREALTAAGVPRTIVCSYWCQGFLLPRAGNPEADGPPHTTATIFGDGQDMSRVAIKAVQDPRTLNRILHPPRAVRLWEEKTSRALEELLRRIQDSPMPLSFQLAMVHATMAVGGGGVCEQTVNASAGVEATELYPDVHFATVQDHLNALG
uniref:NmrA-like domain-containing protein n=1 Tax=Setaria italica TaxID=4555 RepID=K3XPB7_SETIT